MTINFGSLKLNVNEINFGYRILNGDSTVYETVKFHSYQYIRVKSNFSYYKNDDGIWEQSAKENI